MSQRSIEGVSKVRSKVDDEGDSYMRVCFNIFSSQLPLSLSLLLLPLHSLSSVRWALALRPFGPSETLRLV